MVFSLLGTKPFPDVFWWSFGFGLNVFPLEQVEIHVYLLSTMATDDLVLKHQVISTHSDDL